MPPLTPLALLLFSTLGVATHEPPCFVTINEVRSTSRLAQFAQNNLSEQKIRLLPEALAIHRLLGVKNPREIHTDALRALLNDARQREAQFDTKGANAIRREILSAFENALNINNEIISITATANHDLAASFLAEGNTDDARRTATEAIRRFANHPLDAARYPPTVHRLFEDARNFLASMPHAPLLIESDVTGEIFAEGTHLGRIQREKSVTLPVGIYRIWLTRAEGSSLPHRVVIGPEGLSLRIDWKFDQRLDLSQGLHLKCEPCLEDL
ncbi:hypothetical protein KAI87_07485, partial [Myxococcota bacterium]|nr:hypothetical protein [Myxococcota bacterium]